MLSHSGVQSFPQIITTATKKLESLFYFYPSTQKFHCSVFLFVGFWDLYWIFICLFIKLSVQTFQPLIVIYRRENFVYHHWVCTLISLPLSYPFRSLVIELALLKFWVVIIYRQQYLCSFRDKTMEYGQCTPPNNTLNK